eukprot:gb/GEZN01006891.1/.p1 GENE.gb/GEZN01006891.1/~~gb/GEZN01006891.1/.p1  ORF type:complete len:449 (-),score=39.91 gb/GEZN01006891.1/:260-1582(-)
MEAPKDSGTRQHGVSGKAKKKSLAYVGPRVTTFDELKFGADKPHLMRAIREMNWVYPRDIQQAALPLILEGHNLIAQAKAGAGKTACFVLGALSCVDSSMHMPQAMILATNLELSAQIAHVVSKLAEFTNIKCFPCIKGCRRGRVTEQVVVGTAGSVTSKMKFPRNTPDIDGRGIRVFILDEADEMIRQEEQRDTGGRGSMRDQVMDIRSYLPTDVQVLLFSATFSKPIRKLAEEMAPNCKKIIVKDEHELTVDTMAHFFVRVPTPQKVEVLCTLYGVLAMGQMLIFVQTQQEAERVDRKMREAEFEVSFTHGQMDAETRQQRFNDFKDGRSTVLITTNLFSRGIDISAISMVVNYDLPIKFKSREEYRKIPYEEPDFDTFLHRVGRTARAGMSGIAIHMIENDAKMKILQEIVNHYKIDCTELPYTRDVLEQEKNEKGC